MKNKFIECIILFIFLTFSSLCLFAGNVRFKTSDSGFKELWEKEFLFKPVIELNDRRSHVETWLLGGYEHNSSMLNVLLTNLILTSFDNEYVISSEIPL